VQKKRSRTGWVILLALLVAGVAVFAVSDSVRFVVCSAADALVYGFPSDRDWEEARMISEEIVNVHHFTHNSLSQPDKPPVFSNPGSATLLTLPAVIQVYDVQDRAEQDKIAVALREMAAKEKLKPFRLCFYDHENWVVDGSAGGRGPETQLRCLRITADRIHDVAGQKVITYPTP
jgi:hypothetical protein